MPRTEIFQIERRPAGITPFSRRLAVVGSALAHAMVVILGIWVSQLPRSPGSPERPQTTPRLNLVWLTSPGPAGGGGGERSHESGGARATARSRSTDSSDRSSRTSSRRDPKKHRLSRRSRFRRSLWPRRPRLHQVPCRSDATCCAYAGTRNGKWCRNWKWDRERRGSGIWTRCGVRWRHRRRQLSTRQRSHDA